MTPLHCPDCREEYSAIVRCSAESPSPSCDTAGGIHLHLICSRCHSERVERA